ncbi:MAG TPA: metal ABC transporter substrate-binding protein [Actinomycetota bacterium]
MLRWAGVLLVLAALLAGCGTASHRRDGQMLVVTTVSPLTDIARNVAGHAADVEGLVPEGVDSHTFEPTVATAKLIARADLIFVNGLHLEDPTIQLARSVSEGAEIDVLGDHAIARSEELYDFSFPRSGGKPNPHLWMDVAFGIRYAELMRDRMARVDPANAARYRTNTARYVRTLRRLDRAVQGAVDTVPPGNRVLLTYHDSFAYFARHYGMRVIGAIQPSDFAEPSAQEVAGLIDQIRAEHVPAIFGSEVFPSPVLATIADETGAKYEDTLRDDDLPGEPGQAQHSYVGLILTDVSTIVADLGGDPHALDSVRFTNRYD